jgi:hypothetical protein
MVWIKPTGFLALMPSFTRRRIVVTLFDTTSSPSEIITRQLTHRRRGDDVRFSDERYAKAHIAGVVESRGSLPHQWIWNPFAAFGKDDWVPVRLTPLEARDGCTRFQFEKWDIVLWGGEWRVTKYGRFVGRWPTLESAKQFCHEQDRYQTGRLTPGVTLH